MRHDLELSAVTTAQLAEVRELLSRLDWPGLTRPPRFMPEGAVRPDVAKAWLAFERGCLVRLRQCTDALVARQAGTAGEWQTALIDAEAAFRRLEARGRLGELKPSPQLPSIALASAARAAFDVCLGLPAGESPTQLVREDVFSGRGLHRVVSFDSAGSLRAAWTTPCEGRALVMNGPENLLRRNFPEPSYWTWHDAEAVATLARAWPAAEGADAELLRAVGGLLASWAAQGLGAVARIRNYTGD